MKVVLDFDGTIRSWTTGKPEPGVKEALTRLKKAGWFISILSCRTSKEFTFGSEQQQKHKKYMEDFLKDHEIPFDEVLDYDKPIADVYIDDAGIEYNGHNWTEIADRLTSVKNEKD